MIGFGDIGQGSRQAGQHVDSRVMAALGEFAREHDMTVEQRTDFVRHRIVHGILFDEHGIKRGDRALVAQPGPFDQTRQQAVHRWGQAAATQRFARGQANFPLGPGKPGQRIDEQQDPLAAGPEALGQCRGGEGRAGTFHAGTVRRGTHQDCTAPQFIVQFMVEEFAQLAPAFTDQAEDDDIAIHIASDLRQQGGLAATGTREQPDTLAFAERQRTIDGAHAGDQGSLNAWSRCRRGRLANHLRGMQHLRSGERAHAALQQGPAKTVQHLAEQLRPDSHPMRHAQRLHRRANTDAFQATQGAEQGIVSVESDDLGEQRLARVTLDLAEVADLRPRQPALHQDTADPLHTPAHHDRRKSAQACPLPSLPGVQSCDGHLCHYQVTS